MGYRFVPAKGGDAGPVPRSSRAEDPDPDVTEADGLAPDDQARPEPGRAQAGPDRAGRLPAGRAQPARAAQDSAPKDRALPDTEPRQASAAPADRR